ncbi:hypothetical protein M409DRAFT_19298 [Zasmidium cellare ATCC 36951]|uniref:SMP-30/Gluconolactonase/LRE-like region domain-containing protein n=1 Tax=Zasmidium cellare ATCC 36951 TaxID=1080233 RepID=A0A6A6CT94_ZASCE|nr:uncharacterized protein M409DRAFT_19298 [Zasmidium cellare ATCC 36951]KAF2170477.1 hypothetical protein M409DRAFT_19298 [Zasmidium cellare ATCC 36951]
MLMLLFSYVLPLSLVAAIPFSHHTPSGCSNAPSSDPLQTLVHFADGTWAENLYIRADGSIIVSLYEGGPGQNVLVTPQAEGPATVQVLHRFPNEKIGALGIVELEPDVFYFATVERGRLATDSPPGTGQVWSFNLNDFSGTELPVRLVSNLTDSILPNGMTTTQGQSPKKLLVADSQRGVIWRVDPDTGAFDIASNDTLLHNLTSTLVGLGVNGVHTKDDFLYFTNTQENLFGRMPISDSGLQVGPAELLNNLTFTGVDDFTVLPGPGNAAVMASDPDNGTFFESQSCTKRLATTNGTTANKIAWSQMKPNGVVPVYLTSEGGFMDEQPGPITVGGTLSVFEMDLSPLISSWSHKPSSWKGWPGHVGDWQEWSGREPFVM